MDKKIEEILIQIRFEGWERDKEQGIIPYDYTLGDDEFLKGKFKEIMKAIYDLTEELIGEDEYYGHGKGKDGFVYFEDETDRIKNNLRAEQRTKREELLK